MKPTLLIDVDGVLADFTTATLEVVHQLTGRRYEASSVTTWEVFDSIPEAEAMSAVYDVIKGEGGCMGIPVYPGAKEGISLIRKRVHLVAVTTPFIGSKTWVHERFKWLEEHFQIRAKDVIFAKNKSRVHGDFFLDDKPEHVEDWISYWKMPQRAFLWATDRAIHSPPGLTKVNSWEELYRLLLST